MDSCGELQEGEEPPDSSEPPHQAGVHRTAAGAGQKGRSREEVNAGHVHGVAVNNRRCSESKQLAVRAHFAGARIDAIMSHESLP